MQTLETKSPFINGKVVGCGINPDEYHTQEAKRGSKEFVLSRSELCEFDHCPRRWVSGYKSGGSASTEWGTMIDCLALEPEQFESRFSVQPETYPAPAHHEKVKKGTIKEGDPLPWNANATHCSNWEKQHDGKTIVSAKDRLFGGMAIERLYDNEDISHILRASHKQFYATADYRDAATGIAVTVKALIDIVPHKVGPFGKCLIDFKTSRDAHPSKWPRIVFDSDYHIQGAIHLDVFNAATKEERVEFRHIVQENFAPWEPALHMLSEDYLEIGRARYVAMLKRYCRCLAEKRWPGYEESTLTSYQGWALTEPEAWMVGK